jgi:hypothetical protein
VLEIVFEHQGLFKALAEFIDKVTFRSDVAVLGRATFNKDTGGFAQIKKGSRRVNVTFEREYEQIPVITANLIWNTDDSDLKLVDTNDAYFLAKPDYVIGNVTTKGFSIITSERVVRDLRFSWSALAVKDAKTTDTSVVEPTTTPFPSPIGQAAVEVTPTQQPTEEVSPTP